jgi:protein-disulfide isomerase
VGSQRYAGRIEAIYHEGEARGVQGTPTLFVDGRKFQGNPTSDALKAVVDSLLAARRKR